MLNIKLIKSNIWINEACSYPVLRKVASSTIIFFVDFYIEDHILLFFTVRLIEEPESTILNSVLTYCKNLPICISDTQFRIMQMQNARCTGMNQYWVKLRSKLPQFWHVVYFWNVYIWKVFALVSCLELQIHFCNWMIEGFEKINKTGQKRALSEMEQT